MALRGLFKIFFEIERRRSVLVTVLLMVASISESFGIVNLLPALSMALDDNSLHNPMIDKLGELLGVFGLTASFETFLVIGVCGILLKTILRQIAMTYVGYTVADLITSFREDLVHSVFQARWSYFTHMRPGRLSNSLSSQVKRAGEAYTMTAQLFAIQMQILAYMVAGFIVSWQGMLLAIICGGIIGYLLSGLIFAARKYGRKETRRLEDFIAYLNDTMINIRPLKAMNKQNAMHKLLMSRLANVRKMHRKMTIVNEGMSNLSEALQTVMLCSGFYFAIKVFDVSVAEMATIALLIVQTLKYFNKALKLLQNIVNRQAAYENVKELITECQDQAEPNTGTLSKALEHDISLTHVAYSYDEKEVLTDVNLTIQKGQRVVLCGPSGSGKSTIADVILGFITPKSGSITVDGVPLHDIVLSDWRKQIGYVPQEPTLLNDSIFANVTLMDPSLTEEDAWRALELAGAREFVEEFSSEGLQASVGERGSRLSGGQRQRIAIARAIIENPKLLILDEVTSALDPASEERIIQNINALDRSFTIIAITHRKALLDIADEVYEVRDGQLVSTQKDAISI